MEYKYVLLKGRRSPPSLGQVLIGGFSMRKRATVSIVAIVHLSKSLERSLFRFSYPGEVGCPGSLGGPLAAELKPEKWPAHG